MCGRYTLRTSPAEVAKAFGLAGVVDYPPRYNIAPTQKVFAIMAAGADAEQAASAADHRDGDAHRPTRILAPLHWGLIPSWADDPSVASRMINARAETVATKPAYRQAFSKRRCLIVADGFYEWRKIGSGKKVGPGKQPYYIHLADGRPFAFAGLWEHWRRGELAIDSCTIITTVANELLEGMHDRMPVILPPEHYDRWLDPDVTEPARVLPLLTQYPAADMALEPVSTLVNSPRNDSPKCVEPVDEDAPPPGFLF